MERERERERERGSRRGRGCSSFHLDSNGMLLEFDVCTRSSSLSLHFSGHISRWTWVSGRYQNVSVLDFIRGKDVGGYDDNWSYKTC